MPPKKGKVVSAAIDFRGGKLDRLHSRLQDLVKETEELMNAEQLSMPSEVEDLQTKPSFFCDCLQDFLVKYDDACESYASALDPKTYEDCDDEISGHLDFIVETESHIMKLKSKITGLYGLVWSFQVPCV